MATMPSRRNISAVSRWNCPFPYGYSLATEEPLAAGLAVYRIAICQTRPVGPTTWRRPSREAVIEVHAAKRGKRLEDFDPAKDSGLIA